MNRKHEPFKQLSDFEKGRIVQADENGLTQQQISDALGVSQSSVSRFLKHYEATGDYQRQEGSGRKRKLSERDVAYITSNIKRYRNMREDIRHNLGFQHVSKSTITRSLARSGKVSSRFQTRKAFASLKNIRQRMNLPRNI
jgi:predicted transcriptional regulator